MLRRYLYAATAMLAVVTFSFAYCDMVLSYGYRYLWWDSLEHFLGGVCIGFFALCFVEFAKIRKRRILTVLAMVFAVGLAWEAMEYMVGLTEALSMSYEADTIKDLILDCLGGYSAVVLGRYLKKI